MKKTTSPKLSKRLTQYGTLSLAMAGLMDAHGDIIYTDIDPDSAGTTQMNNVPILIDLDNDSTPEFDVRLRSGVDLVLFVNSAVTGASVLGNPEGGSAGNYRYPFALDSGYVIGPVASTTATAWINDTTQTLVFNNCQVYSGGDYAQWCHATDKYLGLRFQIAGQTHYGWARLSVRSTGELPEDWILKDYAYNDVAGESITAGQMPLGIQDNTVSKIKIRAFNKSILLSDLPNQTNYRLFNLSGQSVLTGNISSTTYRIQANTVAKGIYVIELEDTKSKAVMRKKIVL